MSVQTTYPTSLAVAIAGQIADLAPLKVMSGIVEAAAGLAPGLVVFHGLLDQAVRAPAAADAAVADVDAILATLGASTAGIQNFTGAALNGAIGQGTLFPPRNLTITFNSHADWDATTGTFTGLDEHGETITEDFAIPNGGNATVTGSKLFASAVNVRIPAQSGTNGTFTVGTGSLLGPVSHRVAGITIFYSARGPGLYLQKEMIPVLRLGDVLMKSETAVSRGDPVYARFIASGAQVLGEVRSTPDANNCVRIPGMQFGRKTGAGITVVEVNLPA